MQYFCSLLILVSLPLGIRSDWDYVTEQREIASGPRLKDNFEESQGKTVITTAITVDDEKFDDYELKKLFVKNFKLYTPLEREGYKSEPPQTMSPERKARATANGTGPPYGMECFSCYVNGTSGHNEKCHKGTGLPIEKCADAEYCYTEIHPLFVRRGCILPGRVNKTFVCKCPLCNDKPSSEPYHYEYTTISDWAYDNGRLAKPFLGTGMLCKVCETKGTDADLDKLCRSGKTSNYIVCTHKQMCYTNIDDETDFVSRGCINTPAFNSMYFFCNNSRCNNVQFMNPKERIHQEYMLVKEKPVMALKMALSNIAPKSRRPAIHIISWSIILCTIALYCIMVRTENLPRSFFMKEDDDVY